MKQSKFIMMSQRVHPLNVIDNGNGMVIVILSRNIQITHSYKRNDEMTIIFADEKANFGIPTENELEVIYRIHLSNINSNQKIYEYCEKHLKTT